MRMLAGCVCPEEYAVMSETAREFRHECTNCGAGRTVTRKLFVEREALKIPSEIYTIEPKIDSFKDII